MDNGRITIGTRGSMLALAQTEAVADMLRDAHPGLTVELRKIITLGDRQQKASLPEIGGKGLFTAELEAALLDQSIDLAVHSAKDLPTDMPDGLALAAVPVREDPRDALISRGRLGLSDLPPGAVVGTSSLRRQAMLSRHRPDIEFATIRGNVDTRIRKVLQDGQCDATLLAMAGLIRTGLTEHVTAPFELDQFVPAAGQGALALQARHDDQDIRELLAAVHDDPTHRAVACERSVVRLLEAGCQAPLGVHAHAVDDHLTCNAVVVSPDGRRHATASAKGDANDIEAVALRVVRELCDQGAEPILQTCRLPKGNQR